MIRIRNEKIQRYVLLIILCMGAGTLFKVVNLKQTFYDTLITALDCTHTELGNLSTIFGIVNIIPAIIGGIVSDYVSNKKLLVAGLLISAGATFWYATIPSYAAIVVIHVIFGLTTSNLIYWAAYLKGVKMLGDDKEQGKLYGLNEGVRSGIGIVASFAVLALIENASDAMTGLTRSLLVYGGIYVVIAILIILFFPKDFGMKSAETRGGEKNKLSLKAIVTVLKMPGVWLMCILIWSWYSIYDLMTFTTPYLTNVVGADSALTGAIGIIRQYGIGLFAAPIAGIVADKTGRPTALTFCSFLMIAITGAFLVAPSDSNAVMIVVVLTICLGCVAYAVRGLYWAVMPDLKIPSANAGLAIGICSFIGYLPDVYIHTQVGIWLDNYGDKAYSMVFWYMFLCAILTLVVITVCKIYIKRKGKETSTS